MSTWVHIAITVLNTIILVLTVIPGGGPEASLLQKLVDWLKG